MDDTNTTAMPDCFELLSLERETSWKTVVKAARSTMWKTDEVNKEPSSEWKTKILLARHSPIQCLEFWIQFRVKSWVSVHLVRHHEGVSHFVGSQRNDRQSMYDRNSARQDTPVVHGMFINAQEFLFISQRRLCALASAETRNAWSKVVAKMSEIEPELASLCKPMCWWYGNRCPEMKQCGMCKPMIYDVLNPSGKETS